MPWFSPLLNSDVGTQVALLHETQSRPVLVHLAELALYDLGAEFCMIQMPTPAQNAPVPVKSTGTSWAIAGNRAVIEALKGQSLFAHVTLTRSERSAIAALVTDLLDN